MRILYVTTIAPTMGFFLEHFKMLQAQNHSIELACNTQEPLPSSVAQLNLTVHHIAFSRSPLAPKNLIAYKQLKQLAEKGNYDIVHCHTPIAAACTRLACKGLRKKGTKIIYTAHGFHFYSGAPLKNWLIFYPVEWLCAHWTDMLITINKEDYNRAKRHMHAKRVEYVPGVGIDLDRFSRIEINRAKKRQMLNIPEDATLLLSVGELNANKNHEVVIRALPEMPSVYYIIAGKGDLFDHLMTVATELDVSDRVRLLGFRTDVNELYEISDIFVFPSFREGLSVSLMEAMGKGLPCVVSRIRGNTDLITLQGGTLFDPHSIDECRGAILSLLSSDMKQKGEFNSKTVQQFSKAAVLEKMDKLINS